MNENSDSEKISQIKDALDLFWIDDNGNHLTGEALIDETLDSFYEYKDLRSKLMEIQNIIYG